MVLLLFHGIFTFTQDMHSGNGTMWKWGGHQAAAKPIVTSIDWSDCICDPSAISLFCVYQGNGSLIPISSKLRKRWSEISSQCSLRHVPKVGCQFQVCYVRNLEFGWFRKWFSKTSISLVSSAWNHQKHSKVFKCWSLCWWVMLESGQ